jgi:carboxyl-terminal processing protease
MDIPLPDRFQKQSPRQPLITLPVLALLALTAGVAFVAGAWFANSTDSPHNNHDFQVFWDSWQILEREYYYDLPDDKALIHAALQGMFSQAGDRYTFFAPPAVAEYARQRTQGEFGGIGAYVSQNADGQLVITRPFSGMPADTAGLRANDIVLEVNGTSIQGWTFEEAVGLLRGEVGTRVTLLVYRPATDKSFSVEIVRARVELPVTDTAMYGDVGYLALSSFSEKAISSLERDLGSLQEQGARAIILDLRGNPGGLLVQAVGVADLFLDDGVIASQRSRTGSEETYSAKDGDLAETIPLVVLIDGASASASEVVAGALKDHERAALIGQTSFGKGAVQYVHDMEDGSQVHVTAAVWLTPNGTLIDGQGLDPDIIVDLDEASDSDEDPFIKAALQYFEGLGITGE